MNVERLKSSYIRILLYETLVVVIQNQLSK
jgi:hypothetical protein